MIIQQPLLDLLEQERLTQYQNALKTKRRPSVFVYIVKSWKVPLET